MGAPFLLDEILDISQLLTFEWSGLFGAASTLNLMGYIALIVALMYERRLPNRAQSWLSSLIWALHGAIFYIVLISAQIWLGYTPPSVFFTTWSYALRMHAIFAIGGMVALRLIHGRRMTK